MKQPNLDKITTGVDIQDLKDLGVSLRGFLDVQRPLKDSALFAVRLMIIHKRKPHYYSTGVNVSIDDYIKITGSDVRGGLRKKQKIVHERLQRANDLIIEMDGFAASDFLARLRGKLSDKADVWAAFDDYAKELRQKGRIKYADTYNNSKKSFEKFMGDKRKRVKAFDDINKKWLDDYETWAYSVTKDKKPLSQSTIGIHTRNLRVLFNLAVKNGGAKTNPFPEYTPPTSEGVKKALIEAEIFAIGKFETDSEFRRKHRDYFIFSYQASGMNFADMFRLTYDNVKTFVDSDGQKREYIVYERKKTSHKRKATKKTTPYLPYMKKIVERWGNEKRSNATYLFKVVENTRAEEERVRLIDQERRACNTHLKAIAKDLGIDDDISVYTARHSWATHAVLSGKNLHFVQKQMGHSDPKTTEGYVDSLGPGLLERAMSFVVDFD